MVRRAVGVVFGHTSVLYDPCCVLLDLSLTRLVICTFHLQPKAELLLLLPPHLQCACLCLMACRNAPHSDLLRGSDHVWNFYFTCHFQCHITEGKTLKSDALRRQKDDGLEEEK